MAKKPKTRKQLRAKLPDRIADAIRTTAKAKGLTVYGLAKLVEDYVSPATVYQFMADKEVGLRTEVASVLLDALDLEITPKSA